MFKSISVFRIQPEWSSPSAAALEDFFNKFSFSPCGSTQKVSTGWVPPRGTAFSPLIEQVQGHWLFKLQIERKSVPPAVIKTELAKRCAKIEDDTGRKVGRKEKRELKDEVELSLLPRAFSKQTTVLVWLDPVQRLLVVGTSSQKASDEVITALVKTFAEASHTIPLTLVQTTQSPSTSMATWLLSQEAPAGFTLDRDLELRQPDSEKSAVRYARHNLEIEEVRQHIAAGKVPLQVGMTWESRVSFMLDANLSLKKIEFLDDVLADHEGEDAGFDADAVIATSELSRLLPALITALGGETMDYS